MDVMHNKWISFIIILSFSGAAFSQSFSKLKIQSQPLLASVYFDSLFIGKTPLTLDSVSFGKHHILFEKKTYYSKMTSINIDSSFFIVNENLNKKYAQLLMDIVPHNTEITLLGKSVKNSAVIPYGKYSVYFDLPGYYAQKMDLNVDTDPFDLGKIIMQPKSRPKALFLSVLFPGSGQFYSGRETIAVPLFLLSLGGVLYSYYPYVGYNSTKSTYLSAVKNYNAFNGYVNQSEKYTRYKNDIAKKYHRMKDLYDTRKIILVITASLWLYNIWDSYYNFPLQDITMDNDKIRISFNWNL